MSYEGDVTFHSTDPDAGFRSKVGGRLYDDCSSPWHVTGLTAGDQTVTVQAVDAAGNVSGTRRLRAGPCSIRPVATISTAPAELEACRNRPRRPCGLDRCTLSLATLGAVDHPPSRSTRRQIWRRQPAGSLPADGVTFAPVTQMIEDVLGGYPRSRSRFRSTPPAAAGAS